MQDGRPRGWLTEQVAQRLRSAIMDGELALGTMLSEGKLASALGVSRSPVRDAMAALARQGLIVIEPQRASFVFMPTNQDIHDLCQFRRMLELEAMRLAVQKNPVETLAQLQAAARAMERANRAADALGSARADSAFHDAAVAHCDNPYLQQAWQLVSGKVGALRASIPSTSAQANAEHQAIVTQLQQGDADGALATLHAHILKMAERYSVFSHAAGDPPPQLCARPPSRRIHLRKRPSGSLAHLGPLPGGAVHGQSL